MSARIPSDGATVVTADPVQSDTGRPEQPGWPDEAIDDSRERLIDRLVPAEPSRHRRFASALAVVIVGVGFGVLWNFGWVVPQPTLMSTTQQSATMGLSADGQQIVIGWLSFSNSSRATLDLSDIRVDAPGLAVDRITWSDEPGDRQALPVEMVPGASVVVELWGRPETCTDPSIEWGVVSGRWTYPDRPSWWGRWESLDNVLWNPAADPSVSSSELDQSAIALHPVDIDGREVTLDGPLSGACLILGVDQ